MAYERKPLSNQEREISDATARRMRLAYEESNMSIAQIARVYKKDFDKVREAIIAAGGTIRRSRTP